MLMTVMAVLLELHGAAIQGTVRAEGTLESIAGASILLPELRRSVIADAKGYFVVADVPAGQWRVEAAAFGYALNAITVVSSGSGTIRLDFELRVRPIAMPRLEIDAAALGRSGSTVSAPAAAGPPAVRIDGPSLRLLPGLAEPDVLRSLQVLPSVHAMSDFSSALYVRGGAADQNLITLDGIPLFNPYHAGGIFSAIGAAAVSNVDVWAGALPARARGDRLASTVAIHTRDGGRDRTRVEGGIGVLSANLTLDGPLRGGRGGFLVTGRHTYLDVATKAANTLGIIDFAVPYGFSDLYAKFTHQLPNLGSLSVSGYLDSEGMVSRQKDRRDEDGDFVFNWGSKMLAATARQPLSPALLLELRAGYSDFRGRFNTFGLATERDTSELRAHSLTTDLLASVDLTWYNRWTTTYLGAQIDRYNFDHALARPIEFEPELVPEFDRAERATTLALYVENEWRPAEPLEVRLGFRLLEAGSLGHKLLPRAGVHLRVTPALAISAGAGRYAQVMRSMRDDESVASSVLAYDFLAAQPRTAGLAYGDDIVLSAEWSALNTAIRVDGYVKRLRNLILPAVPSDPLDTPIFVTDNFRIGEGSARGIELMARQRVGRSEFTLSYALSLAERRAGDDIFAPRFERRHLLDATVTVPLGESGILSARAVWGSGQPYTAPIGLTVPYRYNAGTGSWEQSIATFISGSHNGARLPNYFRLDFAARKSYEKHWFGREMSLTPYFQVLNLINTRNTLIADPQPFLRPQLRYVPQLPVLPTFGLEWKF